MHLAALAAEAALNHNECACASVLFTQQGAPDKDAPSSALAAMPPLQVRSVLLFVSPFVMQARAWLRHTQVQ